MKKAALLLAFLVLPQISSAGDSVDAFQVYEQGLKATSLSEALKDVRAGDVVILGEEHGTQVQADQQLQVMQTLKSRGLLVSLGMEFFERNHQGAVDAMRSGSLSEADFLSQIGWSKGTPYSAYRNQVNLPQYQTEFVVALNAPRSLTSRISKVGIKGLLPEELALLPADFQVGNSGYYQRFQAAMGTHVPPEALFRYFEAQSTWDEVMAFESIQFMKANPNQVLVIIVGEFHVQYGGGLPDRIRQRMGQVPELSGSRLKTFSLINIQGMSQDEREEAIRPSTGYGQRADYVWTSQY